VLLDVAGRAGNVVGRSSPRGRIDGGSVRAKVGGDRRTLKEEQNVRSCDRGKKKTFRSRRSARS